MVKRIDSPADIEEAVKALKQLDPNFIKIIEQVEEVPLRRIEPGFESLSKIVTSQLISRAAADAIWERIASHFGDLTPSKINQSNVEELKSLGLSTAKANTLIGAAEKLSDDPDFLSSIEIMHVDNATKQLTSLKGVGPWTAQVYLMFCCGHPDIFPSGDVALRTASGAAFFDNNQPDQKELQEYAKRWSPWRSIAARILWAYYANLKQTDINPV